MKKIAIIGAGLSGLTLALMLNKKADVTVFEKSRGIGGRMATRYSDHYEFDHGAQYFTAKNKAFQSFLKPYIEQDIIMDWKPNLVTFTADGIKPRASNHPSYIATPRMNSLAKEMAKQLDVIGETHIEHLKRADGNWLLIDKNKKQYGSFDYVITAIPSHQVIALMPDNFAYREQITNTKMDACFSLMLGFKEKIDLNFDGAFVEESSIGWMSLNSSKALRPTGFSMMIQSHNQWAEAHVEDDKEKVHQALLKEASRLTGHDLAKADHQVLHRWLYASTSKPAGDTFFLDEENTFGCIGDWCIKGRVEAAFESGLAMVEKLETLL